MKRIKIIDVRPILHPDVCEKIVKIFAKRKIKISLLEARHLWDLLSVEKGSGYITRANLTDKEIFDYFEPYYYVDNS